VLINIEIKIMGNIMPFKSVIGTNISVEHAGFMSAWCLSPECDGPEVLSNTEKNQFHKLLFFLKGVI
jgi:hypothetical protein